MTAPSRSGRPALVVVTGLAAEARLAAQVADLAIPGGGNLARLESELGDALGRGAEAVLSFGLAAGLGAGCLPGTVVVASQIAAGAMRYPTDPRWTQRLCSVLQGARAGVVAGVDTPLQRLADKAALHAAIGALAADMESHVAARLAHRAGRPFAVLRVVCDPLERSLPPAALLGLKSDGRLDPAGVLSSLLRHPRQLPQLARLAADAHRAMSVLRKCRDALGPGLGWAPDADSRPTPA